LAANSPSLQRDLAAHGLGIVALDERFAEKMMEQGLLQTGAAGMVPCPP
jgi:DNA-binding transcriptional LysR family regulator